jgi:hypothetical protein
VAWASTFSYCALYSGSLELVPRYCNNLYLNSILFEVRNVFTSLLGLVIVSHLSPKGLGRFKTASKLPFNTEMNHTHCPIFRSVVCKLRNSKLEEEKVTYVAGGVDARAPQISFVSEGASSVPRLDYSSRPSHCTGPMCCQLSGGWGWA